MANIKSAEKRHRQSLKRRARNTHWRSSVKTAVKKVRDAVAAKDPAKAKDALKAAEKTLKKAASKGAVHSRNASRHVGRLMKAVSGVATAK
ncbi:MAG: 30S ribosomal protein S20 [Deltaproteobacteria bacterium]|nr:30S ribosomal protein S20 [Deltaproteobacteria bacterium]